MSKFFQHSYSLREEPRVKKLISETGFEGYGIFLTFVEEIRKLGGRIPLQNLLDMSNLRTQAPKLRRVISAYDLFLIDEHGIVSLNRLNLAQPAAPDRRQLSLFPEDE